MSRHQESPQPPSQTSIKSTFFVLGWTADTYPGTVHKIIRAGHEIAAHGYLHENLSELNEKEETSLQTNDDDTPKEDRRETLPFAGKRHQHH